MRQADPGDATGRCAIESIAAREVFDSRGVPTLEVEVTLAGGAKGRSAAPFGAPGSRGEFEASAYGSVGWPAVVGLVSGDLAAALVGMNAADTRACDTAIREFDGTANFDRIGGNTSSSLSIAIAEAAAAELGIPLHDLVGHPGADLFLPLPLGNVIGGGAHAMGPTPDMQEHLVLPVGARSMREAVALNIEVHLEAGRILARDDATFTGGSDDERAWAADLDDAGALDVVAEAARAVTDRTGVAFRLGLDLAADRFWDRDAGVYRFEREGAVRNTAEQIVFVESLVRRFDLGYVEDAFQSNDYEAFAELRRRVGDACLVCGDDLLATNQERTSRAVELGSVNAMIIKVNQVGTVSAAADTSAYARSHGIATAISHRSGETADTAIAHLAAAWGCSLIKAGVVGGERLAKLNELIRIEEAGAARLAPLPAPLAASL